MKEIKTVSLRKNFAYKGLLTIATPIMGLITFPYVSRVLGVENIGLINFVDNTINYFLLFATMGIGTIGIRAIAASKRNQKYLNHIFSNILGLNLCFTIVVLFIYCIVINLVPRFSDNSDLFYIGLSKILFTSLLIEWLYSGLENFKFITIRSLLIRIIYIVCVFIFIKAPDDYITFFILTTVTIVTNAIVNLFHSRKFVRIVYRELFSKRFLKENITLGIYSIMTSMYLTFNVMYLGLVSDNTQVGYYTSAFKFYTLILSVFTAFTSVMLPRMSSLKSEGDERQFYLMIDKSFSFVTFLAFPLSMCGGIMAPEIIDLLCGEGYEGAIFPMRIIMPAIIFVGIAQVLAIQIIMPMKKDNLLLATSITGAIISLLINLLFVPKLHSIGSALVLLCSEFIVTFIYIIYATSQHLVDIPWRKFINNAIKTTPCAIICIFTQQMIQSSIVSLVVAIMLCIITYSLLNIKIIKQFICH